MHGRKPKPTAMHALEGTLRTTRHRSRRHELKPVGELKDPPLWFNRAQKELWRFALDNAPPQLFSKLEASSLANWVLAVHTLEELAREWNRLGNPSLTKNGMGADAPHPLIGMMQRQSATLTRAAAELGFTPVSRSRVTLPERMPADDLAEGFFDGNLRLV